MQLHVRLSKYIFFFCVILISFLSCEQSKIKYDKGAVPPAEAVNTFEVEPGFKIEQIAAEPLIADRSA